MTEQESLNMPPRKAKRRTFGTITKRRGRYHVLFKGLDGNKYSAGRGFDTEEQADIWLAKERDRQDAARRGFTTWHPPAIQKEQDKRKGLTVGQWMQEYHQSIAPAKKPSTMQQYERTTTNRITEIPGAPDCHDMQRLSLLPMVELSKDDVQRWWDAMVRAFPDTPETNQKAYVRLRAAFAEAARRDLISSNPVEVRGAGVKKKREAGYLPEDWEIQSILEQTQPRYQVLVSLMLFHGLRIGEALALEQQHVTVEWLPVPYLPRVTVHVGQNAQRITPPKGQGTSYMNFQSPKSYAGAREVPIMPAHVMLFVRHLALFAPANPTVVRCDTTLQVADREVMLLTVTATGKPVMDTSFRSVLGRAAEAAGVKGRITPHAGRRWLITRLAERGAHLKEIGRLLGQDDMDTISKIYMQVRAGRTTELMDVVSKTVSTPMPTTLARRS